jgi:hypothetical protein
MSYDGWLPRCFICQESVKLEESKTDDHGRAVHEECYVWTVVLKKPRIAIAPTEPLPKHLSLMTMLMSARLELAQRKFYFSRSRAELITVGNRQLQR